jgi:hypothetical protein
LQDLILSNALRA